MEPQKDSYKCISHKEERIKVYGVIPVTGAKVISIHYLCTQRTYTLNMHIPYGLGRRISKSTNGVGVEDPESTY